MLESPHWLGAPPVASPTSRTRGSASTSAAKFPAAENVERPMSRTTVLPGELVHRAEQRAVGRVVPAVVQADVDHDVPDRGAGRQAQQTS